MTQYWDLISSYSSSPADATLTVFFSVSSRQLNISWTVTNGSWPDSVVNSLQFCSCINVLHPLYIQYFEDETLTSMNGLSLSPVLQSVSIVFMGFHQDRTFVTSSYSLTTSTSVTGLLPSTMHLVTVTAAYNEPECSSIYETYAIKTNSEDDIGLSMLV